MRIWPVVAVAGVALFVTGCTNLTQYALEAGEASKAYVDEKTDRREDLRNVEYQVQDALIDMYMTKARQAMDDGEVEAAEKHFTSALERINEFYPDLSQLADRVRNLRNGVD
jgi:hypothetical protein